jgi:amino acid transporter, AAT family
MLATGLSVTTPPQAPRIFSRTTKRGIPLPALLLTSSVSGLCFGSSFIGSGALWAWLQNLVGVSNQVSQMFAYCFHQLIATLRLLGFP